MTALAKLSSCAVALTAMLSWEAAWAQLLGKDRVDLNVKEIHYQVECRNPATDLCALRRLGLQFLKQLTTDVELEEYGDFWLADFRKPESRPGGQRSLRFISGGGDIHVVDFVFRSDAPVAAAKKPERTRKK